MPVTADQRYNYAAVEPDHHCHVAYCRGFRYVREMLKMLPEQPEPILLAQIFANLTSLGRIH